MVAAEGRADAVGTGMSRSARIEARVAAALAGSVRDTARLLTLVENGGAAAAEVSRALLGRPRAARVIGVTGAPGAGKSTLTDALLRVLRADAAVPRIGVLAVDPSSPFTGGALLGDRVRMADWATEPGVYIRSLSSRGNLGGLSVGTPAAIDLLSALGFDLVIVETVGVGQSEVDVMHLADTVAVVLAPGMGDGVQAAKAGIMEIADILVVNKCDHEGARTTVRELRAMLLLGGGGSAAGAGDGHHAGHGEGRVTGAGSRSGENNVMDDDSLSGEDDVMDDDAHRERASAPADDGAPWQTPIVQTKAHVGEGVPRLAAALADHYAHLVASGGLVERQARRGRAGVESVVTESVRAALAGAAGRELLAQAADSVIRGEKDVYTAAEGILARLVALRT